MHTIPVPTDNELRWEWLKYQLRARATSLAQIARELNVSLSATKNVKRHAYPRIERVLAARLGLVPEQIWPERWNVDGTPVRQRPCRAEALSERPSFSEQSNAFVADAGWSQTGHVRSQERIA